jgi:acetyl/propionyl-CoA carboxylase alpha subunit
MELEFIQNDVARHVQMSSNKLTIGDKDVHFALNYVNPNTIYIRIDNTIYDIYDVQIDDDMVNFMHKGLLYSIPYKDEQAILLAKMGYKSGKKNNQGSIKSPMPGKIISIKKQVGDSVKAGEAVVILEAMKMENELKSPISGVVEVIYIEAGKSVEKNTILIEIK